MGLSKIRLLSEVTIFISTALFLVYITSSGMNEAKQLHTTLWSFHLTLTICFCLVIDLWTCLHVSAQNTAVKEILLHKFCSTERPAHSRQESKDVGFGQEGKLAKNWLRRTNSRWIGLKKNNVKSISMKLLDRAL